MLVKLNEEFRNVCISNPEFKYIFTYDLGGRIVWDVENEKAKCNQGKIVIANDESLIDFRNIEKEVFYLVDMDLSTVRYYIDSYLLRSSTPIRILLNKRIAEHLLRISLERFSEEKINCSSKCRNPCKANCREYKHFHEFVRQMIDSGQDLFLYEGEIGDHSRDEFRLAGIEVKVFRSGAISILVRFRWPFIMSLEDCLNFTKYPENIVIRKDECYLGPMNTLATLLAEQVYKKIFVEEDDFESTAIIQCRSNSHFSVKRMNKVLMPDACWNYKRISN